MKSYPVYISENITFAEAVRSRTAEEHGLKNYPNDEELENMKFIALNIFEVVREHVAKGKPIIVSSFFRQKLVNKKIKGASRTSDHVKGSAMDLQKSRNAKYTNADIFHFIRKHLDFDQLIWEHGTTAEPKWVHVGLRRNGQNRKQVIYNL